MLKHKTIAAVAALGLTIAPFTAVAALAQQAPAPAQAAPTQPAPTAPAAKVDETKLQSFVVAFLEVNKVGQEYQPQLEAAGTDQGKRAQIQEEATKKMTEAVEKSDGITVEEYSTILANAQSDPELAGQINEMIRQNTTPQAPTDTPPAGAAPAPQPAQ
ncbi:MAG TPA: DUF4168 domain-containing protein [Rhizobiaceae bacterium]|nr:DUF4168 domain-containing protein [Rhizobiaceae bacterium]